MAAFRDRLDAGRKLAERLTRFEHQRNSLVLALPRGGVPVGYEVAGALHAPLDVYLVRKLGVPGHEELAMGAIATGGVVVLHDEVIRQLRVPQERIDEAIERERRELARREVAYRDDRPAPDIRDHIVILVDDGLATGSTMRAAAQAVRKQDPAQLVVAVPVAAAETCHDLSLEVDEIECLYTPDPFFAVGVWYDDFSQTTDEEVRTLLEQAAERTADVH